MEKTHIIKPIVKIDKDKTLERIEALEEKVKKLENAKNN